jgi:ubiquinone/menaquinone biosynthesis C-methylase UbiE
MLRRFIAFNRNLCNRIEPHLPQTQTRLSVVYEQLVAEEMNRAPGRVVADIGGGAFCPFAADRDPAMNPRIIAVDISEEEMRSNQGVDEKRIANVLEGLPFGDNEVDLLVSRSVLEHLENLETFLAEAHRAVKPNGTIIHLFPCKFAPFALLNQMLPHRWSRRLLYTLRPESQGIGGFPAIYDRCYYSAYVRLLNRHGFRLREVRFGYYQSRYFSFFVPFYLASSAYEAVICFLQLKNLCSHLLIVAEKG